MGEGAEDSEDGDDYGETVPCHYLDPSGIPFHSWAFGWCWGVFDKQKQGIFGLPTDATCFWWVVWSFSSLRFALGWILVSMILVVLRSLDGPLSRWTSLFCALVVCSVWFWFGGWPLVSTFLFPDCGCEEDLFGVGNVFVDTQTPKVCCVGIGEEDVSS